MKLFSSKKAQGELTEETMYRIFAMIIAFLVLMIELLSIIGSLKNNTVFEKNFFERDMANVIDSLYTSPGNIMLDYDKKTKWFSFKFDEDSVNVYETWGSTLTPDNIVYYFTPDKKTMKFFSKLETTDRFVCCFVFIQSPQTMERYVWKKESECKGTGGTTYRIVKKEKCEKSGIPGSIDEITGFNIRFAKTDRKIQINKKESLVPNLNELECSEVKNAKRLDSYHKGFNDISDIDDIKEKNYAINYDAFIWYYPGSYEDTTQNTIKAFISSEVNLKENRRLACLILNKILDRYKAIVAESDLEDITGVSIIPTDSWQMLNQDYLAVLLEIGNKEIPQERNLWSNEDVIKVILTAAEDGINDYG